MKFNFSDNATVEALEKVPEEFRSLYSPVDGQENTFALAENHSRLVGTLVGLQKALEASRAAERKAKDSFLNPDEWKALGESPDAVKARIEELQKKADSAAGNAADLEKVREEMKRAANTQLEVKDKALLAMQRSLEAHMVDGEASRALSEHDAKSPKLLLPHIRSQVKVLAGDDGQHRVVVLDENGQPRFNGTGLHMTISELVAEMRASDDFGVAFSPKGTAGTGAPPAPSGRLTSTKSVKDMTPLDKIQMGLKARS